MDNGVLIAITSLVIAFTGVTLAAFAMIRTKDVSRDMNGQGTRIGVLERELRQCLEDKEVLQMENLKLSRAGSSSRDNS